jgi:hypothetical protein
MKKKVKNTLIVLCSFILIIAALIFRPVPIVTESEAIVETGIVSEIYTNSGNDVFFELENKQRRYYINRGLEYGLEIERLKNKLIGNSIVVKYPKYWTPLDWNNRIRHVSKLEFDGETLFNEFKE